MKYSVTKNTTQEKTALTNQQEDQEHSLRYAWIISAITTLTAGLYYVIAQPEIPLFYSLATKQDQLTNKIFLFLFPVVAVAINTAHFFILKTLKEYSTIILRLFIGTTLGLQTLLLLACIRIIWVTL